MPHYRDSKRQEYDNLDWKIGDKIGNLYQIHKILGGEGKSGNGIVYVCFDKEKNVYALKTFQNRFVYNNSFRKLFKREALLWIELGQFPYIVRAKYVAKYEGRIFIILEYIVPDEWGRNTLTHFLRSITYPEILKYSIQICYGMDYIYSKGIKVHRDIKPDNIMITRLNRIKITDFGFANIFQEMDFADTFDLEVKTKGLSIYKSEKGRICGTPPYMAPEQWDGYTDKKTDIYAFGITLYQLVTGGQLPFYGKTIEEWEQLHKNQSINTHSLPLGYIIKRCVEKNRDKRFDDFTSIKHEFEELLIKATGEKISKPKSDTITEWELIEKGSSFDNIGEYEKAFNCYNTVLKRNPENEEAWYCKGWCYFKQNKFKEALFFYNKAIEINPNFLKAWHDKGSTLFQLCEYDKAILCFDKVLELNPKQESAWSNKGFILQKNGKYKEAIIFYDKALKINPDFEFALYNKGISLANDGKNKEALICYNKLVEMNYRDKDFYYNIGVLLNNLGRYEEAIINFDKYNEPRN